MFGAARGCSLTIILSIAFSFPASRLLAQSPAPVLTIKYTPGHPVNRFIPINALGVGFDGHEKGGNDLILTPQNISQMLSVGMKPVSYRLRTELGIEAWHWNPKGSWSEPSRKQGYWTSSADTTSLISLSYGYRLPRRGNSDDQANNDGYSRIDDGDTTTFWKSNPYLDAYFTKEPDSVHAQWVVVDLGREERVNAIRIRWANPFALFYTLDGAEEQVYDYFDNAGYFEIDSPRLWKPVPFSVINNKNGGSPLVAISNKPIKIRFLRIRMKESSHTATGISTDERDLLGYAIKEIELGRVDEKGKFTDFIHHAPDNKKQSKIYVSSTDPWHRASDIDSLTEQVGIDRLYRSGLTSGMPVLLAAGLLYDTPENALVLVDYVGKRKYPVEGLELGEEPDGQMTSPEDAGVLYRQTAERIKQRYPDLHVGGPSLQGIILNQLDEILPTKNWMERYVNKIQQHEGKKLYDFFSFEWYPFDSVCAPSAPQLARMPARLEKAVSDMREIKGLQGLPFYITEYGYSAFAGVSEVSMQGALMNADIVGRFLTLGGNKAYLYGWEPNNLQSDFGCPAGNNMVLGMDDNGKIRFRTATYYGAELLIKQWAQPNDKMLEVYPVSSPVFDRFGQELITSYALRSADSTWSVLLINKDPLQKHTIKIAVADESTNSTSFISNAAGYQYSGKQYQWKSKGLNGYPSRNLPPEPLQIKDGLVTLPPYSLTVIRSK
jgi:hypothetical protein